MEQNDYSEGDELTGVICGKTTKIFHQEGKTSWAAVIFLHVWHNIMGWDPWCFTINHDIFKLPALVVLWWQNDCMSNNHANHHTCSQLNNCSQSCSHTAMTTSPTTIAFLWHSMSCSQGCYHVMMTANQLHNICVCLDLIYEWLVELLEFFYIISMVPVQY